MAQHEKNRQASAEERDQKVKRVAEILNEHLSEETTGDGPLPTHFSMAREICDELGV